MFDTQSNKTHLHVAIINPDIWNELVHSIYLEIFILCENRGVLKYSRVDKIVIVLIQNSHFTLAISKATAEGLI